MADDWDVTGDVDPFDDSPEVIKDAFGLPDELPPIRLPAVTELLAMARDVPLMRRMEQLVGWLGEGCEVTGDGDLTAQGAAAARQALGIEPDDAELDYLWAYACSVDWVEFDPDADWARPGPTARAWRSDDEDEALDAWSATFAGVLSEAVAVTESLGTGLAGELDFAGPGMAVMIMMFLARPAGISAQDAGDMIFSGATAELDPLSADKERQAWALAHGNPADALFAELDKVRAIVLPGDGDNEARLGPLALHEMRNQLLDAGVEVRLLPAPEEMTAADVLALAPAVTEQELAAETGAWLAGRDRVAAARELLVLAAAGTPAERLAAVSIATGIGQAAEPAWRDCLDTTPLRGYAKLALAGAVGGDFDPAELPGDLLPLPEDLAWMATDAMAAFSAEDYDDVTPDEVVDHLGEVIPPGQEPSLFALMASGSHPDAADVLTVIGHNHPDKKVAKEARKAAYKARSTRR